YILRNRIVKKHFFYIVISFFSFINQTVTAQNPNSKWCFGHFAGLDFMTTLPSVLTNSLYSGVGSASIADVNGNLLFYTDGVTIYNQNHNIMANGTLLNGAYSAQCALIVKQSGNSNLYYLFTVSSPTFAGGSGSGLCYSIIDMNLAAGMGSVTIKNASLNPLCFAALCGTKHCNGFDTWIVSHESVSNIFCSYLLTSSGITTIAVSSNIGSTINWEGLMKISPNGKKIVSSFFGGPNSPNFRELLDFDNSTGIVSNPFTLTSYVNSNFSYGIEFSPNGTKLYSTIYGSFGGSNILFQWDLCAGSNAAVIASQTAIYTYTNYGGTNSTFKALQLAPNGKIYLSKVGDNFLGIINNPNLVGLGCNYFHSGQSLSPAVSWGGLPNFISTFQKPPFPPIVFNTTNQPCQTASF
ncbi:MAG: hypothetical protein EBT39_06245, partial [Sphingobacteriia bacterium]|nr:hypothetical protein [Candidatus Fonsibacter lacus]